ncbi:MAG: hypothetical protein QXJ75_00485 [Candidatus Bathyarchaeia archaeon]
MRKKAQGTPFAEARAARSTSQVEITKKKRRKNVVNKYKHKEAFKRFFKELCPFAIEANGSVNCFAIEDAIGFCCCPRLLNALRETPPSTKKVKRR